MQTTNMERIAFKMKLKNGAEQEYKTRHDNLWPELKELLKRTGICDYSIFLDESNTLFAVMKVENSETLNTLPANAVMQKWWAYMRDLMECNDDNSPVSIPLKEVFHLP
jgi:L-rhamnose mutarotase